MQVAKDTLVTISAKMYNLQGDLMESADELVYLHGHSDIFPVIEKALEGKKPGETVTVQLEPEEAFGDYDETALIQDYSHEGRREKQYCILGSYLFFGKEKRENPKTYRPSYHPEGSKGERRDSRGECGFSHRGHYAPQDRCECQSDMGWQFTVSRYHILFF